ncbi:NUDIX domain-containing protein [Joostella sp. CR20]|uniref:NUDIX domain-containing protein n=1 Tax=Joostella sp. CR20 TaxID=2804312 RepID=UPI00313F136E
MNNNIEITKETILSNEWYCLKKIIFQQKNSKGITETISREVYDRGNGAAILLYNPETKNIILTRQFRMPTYLNENESGMMIEVPAGIIEDESPEKSIIRETDEETGYQISEVKKVFETYTSPGAVTEKLHLYVGKFNAQMKTHQGGGLDSEHEDIEVFEVALSEASEWIKQGKITDAKTIMLIQYAQLNALV